MASKVFIVTGASKGLGAAIVKYLVSQSHKVVITARSEKLLHQIKLANPEQVDYIAGDITDSDIPTELVDKAVSSFGQLDGIVINHSILENKLLSDETLMESLKRVYDVNVFSCMAMAHAGLAEIKKTHGCIVWISSGASTTTYQAWGSYGSGKAAINSLSAHLALENPEITSISIGPGRVDTDMQATIRSTGQGLMDPAVYQTFVDAHEAGDLLKPETPGNVIARVVANPDKALSGKYFSWKSPELSSYQA